VLRDRGRLASVVIEPAPGLDRVSLDRARALGPSNLTTEGDLIRNVERAGLRRVVREDWTGELAELLSELLSGLDDREDELRAAEGDEIYEHELGKKRALQQGVDEGLLVRTLVVAER